MRRLLLPLLLLLGSGGCTTTTSNTATGAGPSFSWTVTLEAGGDVDVGAAATVFCFRGKAPDHVGPESKRALPHLLDVPRLGKDAERGPELAVDDIGIVTKGLPDDACISFAVDVEAAAKAIEDPDLAARAGRAVVTSPDVWLWRPRPWVASGAGTLVVKSAAPGLVAAVPFPVDADGRFTIAPSTFALQCFAALGKLDIRERAWRGATLRIARMTSAGLDDASIDEWLRVAVDDVAVPTGSFPAREVLVLLLPVRGKRPVIAGFLGRGGGASALFYLGEGPLEVEDDPELLDEDGRWVFTHELAHTLLPPVSRGDGWLNEGITTWHQEVLPAAAGRRERAAAEAQLAIGFSTGRARAQQDALSVEESCTLMDQRHSYQHCYWAGARLIALLQEDVGDAGVFALVRALHASRALDAAPVKATALLQQVTTTTTDEQAKQAAQKLLALWELHRSAPFPP